MKWIVIAIVAFIVAYTFITLHFRKPGKAHEPYQDARNRVTQERLVSAGYTQVTVLSERPAEPARAKANITGAKAVVAAAIGGLTPDLTEILVDKPVLPDDFTDVAAAGSATAMLPYAIFFTCELSDHKGLVSDSKVYVKESRVAIVTSLEKLSGELLARTKESAVLLTIPAGTFQAGQIYEVTLIGKNGSRRWSVQVH